MARRPIWLSTLVVGACTLACAPTETGNPPVSGALSLALQSSAPDEVAIAPDGAPIVVERAWLGVGRLGYTACSGGFVGLLSSTQAMELASGLNTRESAEPPAGRYCDLELVLSPTVSAEAPSELKSYGLFVSGRLSRGNRFEVLAGDLPVTRTFGDTPLERGPGSPPLLLVLDVARLLTPLGLGDLAADADGVVRAERPSDFGATLSAAYSLHEDKNGNGRVDPDEPDLLTPP
jgi:hypothetical protein